MDSKFDSRTHVPASAPTAVEAAVRAATARANVVPLKPLTDDEAIAWLRLRPDGRTALPQAELARRWAWYPMRVSRQLKDWSEEGLIRREDDGTIVAVMPAPAAVTPAVSPPVTDTSLARAMERITRAVMPPVTVPDTRESGAANAPIKRAQIDRSSYMLRTAQAPLLQPDDVTRVTVPEAAHVIPPPVTLRPEVDLIALRRDIKEYAQLHRQVEH
jgi:hypothetical protein